MTPLPETATDTPSPEEAQTKRLYDALTARYDLQSVTRAEWRGFCRGAERPLMQKLLLGLAKEAQTASIAEQSALYRAAHATLPLKGGRTRAAGWPAPCIAACSPGMVRRAGGGAVCRCLRPTRTCGRRVDGAARQPASASGNRGRNSNRQNRIGGNSCRVRHAFCSIGRSARRSHPPARPANPCCRVSSRLAGRLGTRSLASRDVLSIIIFCPQTPGRPVMRRPGVCGRDVSNSHQRGRAQSS